MKKTIFILICLFVTTFSVAQLNVSIVANPYDLCIGDTSVLTANVNGGTQPYSYLWSDNSTTSTITVTPTLSSIYSVTVTDNSSSSDSAYTNITVDSLVIDSIHVTHNGNYFELTPAFHGGGIGPYTFYWSFGIGFAPQTIIISDTVQGTICVTISDGVCIDSSCVNVFPNSIYDYSKNDFISIFPNPATDKITIKNTSSFQQDFSIGLINIQGQDLFNKSIIIDKTFTIDVSGLDNGFYIITLQNNKTYYKFKTIIQK